MKRPAPRLVKKVKSREGQVRHGFVQKRTLSRVRRYGGKLWASWARRISDEGLPFGAPEKFETYNTEAEAVSHAHYAAGTPRKTKDERLLAYRKRRSA